MTSNSIKQFGKESMIYSFGHVLIRFVSFMLLPVYTNSFSQSQFGTLSLVFTFIGLAQIFYNYGMASALMKFFANQDENRQQVVSTIFFSLLITSIIFSAFLWIFAPTLAPILFSEEQPIWIRYCSGILFLDAISIRAMILLRFDNKPMKYVIFAFTNVFVTMAANIIFVVKMEMGVTGAIQAMLIAAVISCILVIPTLWKYFRFSDISGALLKRILSFGLPFIPATFFQFLMDLADRYLIEWIGGGREMVGIYSAGYKLGSLMLILITGLNLAWQPFFLAKEKDPQAPFQFARIANYFTVLLTAVWIIFILFVDDLVRIKIFGFSIIGDQFWSSIGIVPIIMLGYIALGFYDLLMPGIFYQNQSKLLPVYRAIGAVSNIILNLLMIPIWGITGAAWATCISFILMSVTLYFKTQKLFYIPFKWGSMTLYFGFGLIIFFSNSIINFSIGQSLLIVVLYLLIVFYSLRNDIRKLIKT